MTPTPDGAAEPFMSITGVLPIIGPLQGTDLRALAAHQGTGRQGTDRRALADRRAADRRAADHRDQHRCPREGADKRISGAGLRP